MLDPRQSELLSHESRVYGKPWFWQRNSCTMESSRSLARVIMEMRNEIKKLETENKVLRGEIEQPTNGTEQGELTVPPHNLRRNASAPALEGQYKENIVMTVRRYSVASKMPDVIQKSEGEERLPKDGDVGRESKSSWGRLHQEVHAKGPSIVGNSTQNEICSSATKLTNRLSLQEYVHKNRSKVKTVTFLLPVDDIYTNRPALANHLPNLDATAETDS
ncbi:uncharacterized protein LOC109615747 [Esox lucius]|uniref:uncharacterized protein LOC109615747 n=1 Tax=Esox lucius TaxID=8010 RepID=UPI00097325F3|nr:uncharacterized protein LOC109615747 [Esox lucius]